jgi:TolA-binding protein
MARLNLQDGRYQEARTVLEPLARSTDAAIRDGAEESLVHCLLELKQFPAAAQVLDGILKRLPAADSQRFRVQLTLGHCRYRQEQFEPAAVAYAEAARSTDAEVAAEALYWGANARSAQARHADAAALFGRLVERHPAHALAARAQLRAADELVAAKQTEPASAAYRRVIQLFPRSREAEEARQGLSALTASLDDPVKLLAALKTAPAAERVPGTLRAARLFLQKRLYADAATTLRGLAPLKPTPPQVAEGRYLLGLAEEGGGRTAPAVAALDEAVRAGTGQPWLADAHARLAWLHLDQKQPARSEASARAALGLSPAPELARQAQTALLQAQMDQQKWEPALETCSALLASMPDTDATLTVLQAQASIHVRRGRPGDALPVWDRIVREYPRTPAAVQAVLDRADHFFEAKDWPAAAEGYRGAAATAAAGPLRHEARFKYGSTLYHQEKYVEAAAEWDAVAAEKEAGDYGPEALYWAGAACEKAGKSAEAIDRLTRFVTAHPRHARAANAKVRLAALKAVAGGE